MSTINHLINTINLKFNRLQKYWHPIKEEESYCECESGRFSGRFSSCHTQEKLFNPLAVILSFSVLICPYMVFCRFG